MVCAYTKCTGIAGNGEPPSIFMNRHDPVIPGAPSRFVFRLIHLVVMVTEIVVQDPDI